MRKEYLELDGMFTELELMQERAKAICGDLSQDYFGEIEPRFLKCHYQDAGIKSDIVFDYLCFMDEKMREIRGVMEME